MSDQSTPTDPTTRIAKELRTLGALCPLSGKCRDVTPDDPANWCTRCCCAAAADLLIAQQAQLDAAERDRDEVRADRDKWQAWYDTLKREHEEEFQRDCERQAADEALGLQHFERVLSEKEAAEARVKALEAATRPVVQAYRALRVAEQKAYGNVPIVHSGRAGVEKQAVMDALAALGALTGGSADAKSTT